MINCLRVSSLLRFLTGAALFFGCGFMLAEDRGPIVVSDEALKLHNSALLIDGHNDLPWEIRTKGSSDFS
jgi:hypothetical protein